ncbi:hypothetical protein HNR39_001150 [Glaciimonas immobilis]|uniref:Uncharacterized protein n=1 Tax=Glaciimonas immobilis TaxID=728004 RepID=A0A840RNI3_9BURK|nr:hypothetical protein [Glaciimonas immobilis]
MWCEPPLFESNRPKFLIFAYKKWQSLYRFVGADLKRKCPLFVYLCSFTIFLLLKSCTLDLVKEHEYQYCDRTKANSYRSGRVIDVGSGNGP